VVEKESHKFEERQKNGTVEVKESGNGDKLVTKETTEGRVETKVPKEENKAKLKDKPVENEKTMQREIDEIKGGEERNEVLNTEKDGLVKKGNEQNDKGIKGKIEIANELVAKNLLEMRKNEGETESVNKKYLPEDGPTEKANTEQKEICGDVALEREFSKIEKDKDSGRMTEIANGLELVEESRVKVAREEANTNECNDGELVFKIDTYSLSSLFSI